jgi:probable rRNA maturation factor
VAKAILHLCVQYACNDDELPSRQRIRRWVAAALQHDAEVTVRFVDAEEGRQLNRDYRGKDYATNVLSFAYGREPTLSGDLVLCVPVLRREAAAQQKQIDAHSAHLIVHGMLHLQGYDHETGAADALRMENMERNILAGLGFADPY